jgi:hypothetical protein
MFQCNHRPCYIDLDASEAFGSKTAPISPPCQRQLQLHDPRIVEEYLATLNKQLQLHNILEKVTALQSCAPADWGDQEFIQYEKIDKLVMESMLYAERAAGSRYTKTYEWSPVLLQAVHAERFWRLAIKRYKGRFVSDNLFTITRDLAGILTSFFNSSLPGLFQCLINARQTRKALQKDHHTLRQNYITGLAEALVLKRAPNLASNPKYDERCANRTAKEVKRLIRLQHKRYLYHLIGRQLGDNHANTGGLTRVDVPASMVGNARASDVDPKTWQGPWVPVTDPNKIAQYVSMVNTKQYNQAKCTPFGSGYLMHQIGMNLEDNAVDSVLDGSFQIDPSVSLFPEAHKMLR